jgi:hypothetical protein
MHHRPRCGVPRLRGAGRRALGGAARLRATVAFGIRPSLSGDVPSGLQRLRPPCPQMVRLAAPRPLREARHSTVPPSSQFLQRTARLSQRAVGCLAQQTSARGPDHLREGGGRRCQPPLGTNAAPSSGPARKLLARTRQRQQYRPRARAAESRLPAARCGYR